MAHQDSIEELRHAANLLATKVSLLEIKMESFFESFCNKMDAASKDLDARLSRNIEDLDARLSRNIGDLDARLSRNIEDRDLEDHNVGNSVLDASLYLDHDPLVPQRSDTDVFEKIYGVTPKQVMLLSKYKEAKLLKAIDDLGTLELNKDFEVPTSLRKKLQRPYLYSSIIKDGSNEAKKQTVRRISAAGTNVVGRSGRLYQIERVLQEKENPLRCVYLATLEKQKFVVKDILPSEFQHIYEMQCSLNNSPYLRLVHDTVPSESMFVYEYLTDHLLSLLERDLPIAQIKRILKDALLGLAVLHDRDIVHADIKANNILVDFDETKDGIAIKRVQLSDLEDVAYIPSGSHIVGFQVGNQMWRSPEAHAQGSVEKPSDIFSFGIVCIYVVFKFVIFAVNKDELDEDLEPLAIIIERQISYFADEDGMKAFLKYLGSESPWVQVFEVIRDGFNGDNPRRPFALWQGVDDEFKDLIGGMTNFDPEKRMTVHEVLAHPWFRDG